LTSPGRQHNNADALSRTPCKVCLRHQERNTEEKSEPECATASITNQGLFRFVLLDL
jgi:hypothetical protein